MPVNVAPPSGPPLADDDDGGIAVTWGDGRRPTESRMMFLRKERCSRAVCFRRSTIDDAAAKLGDGGEGTLAASVASLLAVDGDAEADGQLMRLMLIKTAVASRASATGKRNLNMASERRNLRPATGGRNRNRGDELTYHDLRATSPDLWSRAISSRSCNKVLFRWYRF